MTTILSDAGVQFADGSLQLAAALPQILSLPNPTLAANALTLPASALSLAFRSATLGDGVVPATVTGTFATLVIPSGATLGTVNAVQSSIVEVVMNNAGTLERAVVNLAGGNDLSETGLISTTAISAAATAANVFYSNTARTNLPYRVVRRIDSTQATAGAWVTSPSLVQGAGGMAMDSLVGAGTGKWINRTGSRSQGTTYYNTDGVERKVALQGSTGASADEFIAIIDGVATVRGGYAGNTLYSTMSTYFSVPAGSSYSVTSNSGSVSVWMEAR